MLTSARKTISRLLSISQASNSNTPVHMEDWEVINHIDQNLKQGNINVAMSFLIKSHLSGQILDMQTFRNMHYKMIDLKADLSYHELTYKLYREYFKPHVLMLEWMKMLTYSQDSGTLKLLQEDYKQLNVEIPKVQKTEEMSQQQQQLQKQKNSKKKQSAVTSEQANKNNGHEQKVDTESKKSCKKLEIPDHEGSVMRTLVQLDQKNLNNDGLPVEGLKTFIEGLLTKDMKIQISDIEIFCGFDEDEDMHDDDYDEQHEDQQEYEKEYHDEHDQLEKLNAQHTLMDALSSISRIKIGKIEIQSKNDSSNDDKNKNDK